LSVNMIKCPNCGAEINVDDLVYAEGSGPKPEGKVEGLYSIVALLEDGDLVRMLLREVPFSEEGSSPPPRVTIERIPKSEAEEVSQAVSKGLTEAFRIAAEEGLMPRPRSFIEVSMFVRQEQYKELGSPPLHSLVKLTFQVRK